QLGRPEDALAVAEEGLRRWPDHPNLRDELYLSRAELTDWALAVRRDDLPQPGHRPELTGAVTTLGSIGGGEGPVEGWISQPDTTDSQVSLLVNGTKVVSTTPRPAPGDQRWTFALNCNDLRGYVGNGDVITVEHNGRPLAIDGGGMSLTVRTDYESR